MILAYTTKWWRFSEYTFETKGSHLGEDGKWVRYEVILPAAGADLEEYDPWAEYLESRGRGGAGQPAHQDLVSVGEAISFDINGKLRLESKDAILRWCRQYGLLGVAPQFYLSLPAGTREVETLDGVERCPFLHVRWAGSWMTVPQAGPVVASGLGGPVVAESRNLSKYFPGLSKLEGQETMSGGYRAVPLPLTEKFWRVYGEPLPVFISFARDVRLVIKNLTSTPYEQVAAYSGAWADPNRGWDYAPDENGEGFWKSKTLLDHLTGSVGTVLEGGVGPGFRQAWASPSLLASIALMTLQDLATKRRACTCANCGMPFLSNSPKAAYCSVKCRNATQKRRNRARKKATTDVEGEA